MYNNDFYGCKRCGWINPPHRTLSVFTGEFICSTCEIHERNHKILYHLAKRLNAKRHRIGLPKAIVKMHLASEPDKPGFFNKAKKGYTLLTR